MAAGTVLAIGNSHLDALTAAIAAWEDGAPPFQAVRLSLLDQRWQPCWKPAAGRLDFHPGYVQAIHDAVTACPDAAVLCFWCTNVHFHGGMFRPERAFDFVMPALPGFPPDPELDLVPHDLVREHVRDSMRPWMSLPRLVQEVAAVPVVTVPPPPPIRSSELARELLERLEQKDLRRQARRPGMPGPGVRLKFWRMAVDVLGEYAAELGSPILPVPVEACDPDGFLREEFISDALHANAQYGRLLAAQAATRLSGDATTVALGTC